jgi:ABC-2 type transport system permease protein
MTTMTLTRSRLGHDVGFGGALRSEWIKFWTLRSTYWALGTALVLSVGISLLAALAIGSITGPDEVAMNVTAGQLGAFGIFLTQLVFGVLGAIFITGEYGTGMIRSTFAAVPTRLPALFAKAVVLFMTAFAAGLAIIVAATVTGSLTFASVGRPVEFAEFGPEVALPIVGGALFLALLSVFALGVGAIVRAGAGAIAIVLGLLLIVPMVLGAIPVEWVQDVSLYTIASSGPGLADATAIDADFWRDLLVTLAWPTVAMAGAAAVVVRRDA